MHEQICSQVEQSLLNISPDVGSFNIDVQNPENGKSYKFVINPAMFKNKPQHEIKILVQEQIAKQMRDAGLDISGKENEITLDWASENFGILDDLSLFKQWINQKDDYK